MTAFSFTLVWYFSFPSAIVTNASFVPFFPFTFRPFAFFTAKSRMMIEGGSGPLVPFFEVPAS